MRLSLLLLPALLANVVHANIRGAECKFPGGLEKAMGEVSIHGSLNFGGKAIVGAYMQLVDNFQAVNDVVAHANTDENGNFKLNGQFYHYADTDLMPSTGRWKVVSYSYANMSLEQTNHCHRVHKVELGLQYNTCLSMGEQGKAKPVTIPDVTINLEDSAENVVICLGT